MKIKIINPSRPDYNEVYQIDYNTVSYSLDYYHYVIGDPDHNGYAWTCAIPKKDAVVVL